MECSSDYIYETKTLCNPLSDSLLLSKYSQRLTEDFYSTLHLLNDVPRNYRRNATNKKKHNTPRCLTKILVSGDSMQACSSMEAKEGEPEIEFAKIPKKYRPMHFSKM